MNRIRPALFALAALSVAGEAWAHEGWGIVVQPDGTLYFADIPTNTIWRVTREGRLEMAVPDRHSHALVRAEDGSIYGTDERAPQRAGRVWRLAPNGELTTVSSTSKTFEASLHPFLIAPDGAVFSTNAYAGPNGPHRLLRRSASGEVSVVVDEARGIDGLAWGPGGAIYFTDTVSLRRLERDGTVVTVAERLTEPSFGEDLMGVEVDRAGNAWVADYSGARVLRVAPDGGRTSVHDSGWPWSPTGVAHRGSSTFVLEHLRMPYVVLGNLGIGPYIRVLRVDVDGALHEVAIVWGRHSWLAAGVLCPAAMVAALAIWAWRRRAARRRGLPARGRGGNVSRTGGQGPPDGRSR